MGDNSKTLQYWPSEGVIYCPARQRKWPVLDYIAELKADLETRNHLVNRANEILGPNWEAQQPVTDEITPEMFTAGRKAFHDNAGNSGGDQIRAVYRAMRAALQTGEE